MNDRPSLNYQTRICAVVGNPISHSMSPAIHTAGYAELGLDYAYVPCEVDDIEGMLMGMRAMHNFHALSVTIPHKTEVMKYVDEVVEIDRMIGSINTVVKQDGKLVGMGTDGLGALKALTDNGVDLQGKTVLILGCGGAARAVAFTLARRCGLAGLIMLDIDEKIMGHLSADLRKGTEVNVRTDILSHSALAVAMECADLVINCTPVGMHPNVSASLVPKALFRPGQVVFDIIYNPLQTKLLKDAEDCGLKIICGIDMFVNQALLQFEMHTGKAGPKEIMRRVALEKLQC